MLSYKLIFWNKQISVGYNSLIFISISFAIYSNCLLPFIFQKTWIFLINNYWLLINTAIKCLYLKMTILKLKYIICIEILCLIYIIIAFYNWITFHQKVIMSLQWYKIYTLYWKKYFENIRKHSIFRQFSMIQLINIEEVCYSCSKLCPYIYFCHFILCIRFL